jgi:hypothetical protein
MDFVRLRRNAVLAQLKERGNYKKALVYTVRYSVINSLEIYNYNGGEYEDILNFTCSDELSQSLIEKTIRDAIKEKIGNITILTVVEMDLLG